MVTLAEERDDVLSKVHLGKSFDGESEMKVDDVEAGSEVHCDFDTCVAAIKTRYCWKGIKKDVANWVNINFIKCFSISMVINYELALCCKSTFVVILFI